MQLKQILCSISETCNFSQHPNVIFLNTGDIFDGKILHNNYSESKFLPGQAKKTIKNQDILFSEIRPANKRFALVCVEDPQNYVVSTKLMVLRCYNSNYSVDYVYSFLTQPRLLSKFQTLAESRSGTFPQITFSEIANLEIPEFSLAEQRHIVDILGSIDEKIENNELLIQKIEEKVLLEYDRINSFEPLSEIVMSDCFDITIGKTPPRKESHWFTQNSTDVKWLSISDLGKSSVFCFDTSERITPEGISKYNVKVVPKNTVVLSFKLTVGKVAITGCDMATNEAIAHFNSSNHCLLEYLYCYLKRYNFDTLGNTSSIATAVNSKAIKAMHFFIPDDTVLENFHHKTLPLFENIRQLIIENQKLNELKQLYLKKFFG